MSDARVWTAKGIYDQYDIREEPIGPFVEVAAYEALRQQLADVTAEREEQESFYAVRWQRLRELLQGTSFWTRACAIMANGTATPEECPVYSILINKLKNERDAVIKERDELAKWNGVCELGKELLIKERDHLREELARTVEKF